MNANTLFAYLLQLIAKECEIGENLRIYRQLLDPESIIN